MRQSATVTAMLSAVVSVLALTALAAPSAAEGLPALPADFEFGVAQSGFQSEGFNQDSNYLRYGNEGKLHEPVGNAVDFFHQYEGDVAKAASIGVDNYRLSVEWSRIEPQPGVDDAAGWAFYDAVIGRIVASGMRPMITLNHWVHPGWAVDRGGWNNPEMAAALTAFGRRVVDRYTWAEPIWITFNEPSEYVRRELTYGGLAPVNTGLMVDGIIEAHRAITTYIHAVQPGGQVSSNIAYIPLPGVEPALEAVFSDRMVDSFDFIGVDQYYSIAPSELSSFAASGGSFWNLPQSPESMYYVLRYFATKYPNKPLRVIENGLATDADQNRADGYRRDDHLRDTVYWIQRARQDGINIVSYNYWSLTDNYEWGEYGPRFGLYSVDTVHDPALTRRPTVAVAAYREITEHHGVPSTYRPTRQPAPCSLIALPDSCGDPVLVEPR